MSPGTRLDAQILLTRFEAHVGLSLQCYQLGMKQQYPVDDELFIFVTLAADERQLQHPDFDAPHELSRASKPTARGKLQLSSGERLPGRHQEFRHYLIAGGARHQTLVSLI